MRTTIVAVAVLALATCPLAACSKSDVKPNGSTTTAAITPTASAPPAKPVGASYTKADLDSALLTLSDLPSGYTLNTEAGTDHSVMSSCSEEAFALDSYRKDAQATAGITFNTTSGTLVVQSLILLSGDAENSTLVALKNAVARCSTWSIGTSTYTMSKASYGPYGEESLSYRVTVKSDVPFVLDVVFFRKANILVGVMVGNAGSATTKNAQTIFDTASRKPPRQ